VESPGSRSTHREVTDGSIRYDQVADIRDGEVVLDVKALDVGAQASATRASAGEGIAQARDEIRVPLAAEELEAQKRQRQPVVTEEVRVSRTRRQEERRADAEVRHEEARIGESGDVKRSAGEGTVEEDLPRPDLEDPER
jgi:uncharacterized protein (TIGR02271 family)